MAESTRPGNLSFVGLPVRLTEKVDKKLRLFKGKRGHISSWTLAEGTVVTACNSGFVLSKQPLGIYVNFPGETWQVAPSLPRGTYLFTPATRNWLLCRRSGMSALRTGYFLVPDFATTAHMAQGQSLPALFLLHRHGPSRRLRHVVQNNSFGNTGNIAAFLFALVPRWSAPGSATVVAKIFGGRQDTQHQ